MGGGCLILFALPFAGVGVFMTTLLVVKFLQYREVQSWEVVPATILSASLETHRDDDGNTYRAVASYEYVFGGTTYRGDRVSLHGGADNVGKFQRRAAEELQDHQRSKKPFPCRVDPDSPEDSILYADVRLGMMALYAGIGLVFGTVGFGMLMAGYLGGRMEKAEKARRLAAPDSPWEWGEGWKEGRIKSSGKGRMWVMLILSSVWCGVSFPLVILLWEKIVTNENRWTLLLLLLPMFGAFLALSALRLFMRHRKFGVSTFEMAAVPGVVGGKLAGAILTNRHLDAEDGFVVRLMCEETVTKRRGGESTTSTSVIWEDERVLTGELLEGDRSRSAVPVLFGIPYDAAETSQSGRKIRWRLRLDAAVPGVDYSAEFEVPVFRTDESAEDFVLDESPIAHLGLPDSLEERLRRTGAKVKELGGDGLEIAFPMCMNRGALAGLSSFTAVWIGMTVLFAKLGAPIIFPIVFGAFGALMVLGILGMIFSNKRLELRSTELVSSGGLFGKRKSFPYSGLAKVEKHCGMQAGTRSYYSIRVEDNQGRSASVTPDLRPVSTAEALLSEIQRRIAKIEESQRI